MAQVAVCNTCSSYIIEPYRSRYTYHVISTLLKYGQSDNNSSKQKPIAPNPQTSVITKYYRT